MKNHITSFLLLLAACTGAYASDVNQASERIDPTLEISAPDTIDYSRYRFLRADENSIAMNGADWSTLAARFRSACEGDSIFSIVYLGDSHIQADFGGSVLRRRIADVAGSAGRGLIIPFRIAGTNQPVDYTMTTGSEIVASRLLKQPWSTDMPFTGIGVVPSEGNMLLKITAEEPFDRITVLTKGPAPAITSVYGGSVADGILYSHGGSGSIALEEPRMDVHLRLSMVPSSVLAGVVLRDADAGSFVHSIGNNGATYGTYNQVNSFGDELAALRPDLVIIALGTNEAFGTFTRESLETDIDSLVRTIRAANPRTEIMMVTPTECFRKKNRRRRRSSLVVNTKVATVRSVVRDYAEAHGIPLYDTYAIAGGAGSAAKMKSAAVLGHDGVHFTSEGYRLWGALLSDALLRELLRGSGGFLLDINAE